VNLTMYASELKAKMRRRELTVGTWLIFDFWPGYLEIYKKAGMDFVILDMEHGSATLTMADDLCRLARVLELPLILRAEASQYPLLRKYIDMGPAGIILPWVESEEQVQTLQDAMFCAPRGRRGPGGPAVLGAPSLDRAGWAAVEESLCVMLQVETPAGVQKMRTVMNRDWIDAVLLGPYDLSLNMGHCGEMRHPDVVGAITRVIEGAHSIGKPCGMPVGDADDARFWIERGCSLVVGGEATIAARRQAEAFLKGIGRGKD
jgi:4-hydroxy-2-oxoheptanedioate aldolase